MSKETEIDPALLDERLWILTGIMISQYAERSISSLAERAILHAKHANGLQAWHTREVPSGSGTLARQARGCCRVVQPRASGPGALPAGHLKWR